MTDTVPHDRLSQIHDAAQEKVDQGDWTSMVTARELVELTTEVGNLRSENASQRRTIETLEKFRPHWAKGFTADSVAAQSYMNATLGMWEALGVDNQTAAIDRIRQLLEIEAEHAPGPRV